MGGGERGEQRQGERDSVGGVELHPGACGLEGVGVCLREGLLEAWEGPRLWKYQSGSTVEWEGRCAGSGEHSSSQMAWGVAPASRKACLPEPSPSAAPCWQ